MLSAESSMSERGDKEISTAIILTVPSDFNRLLPLYHLLEKNLPVENIVFIGNQEVGQLLAQSDLGERYRHLDEERLISFDAVKCVIEDIFRGQSVTRGFVGWYYQQFLKLAYAAECKDAYYLSWDGDTVPIRKLSFFSQGKPYMGIKKEYHAPYFRTLETLFPGMHKVIADSFIAEHMVFAKELVLKMLDEIMEAEHLKGDTFYERILRAIGPEALNGTSFSEFETYGTYTALREPERYRLRRWLSFRHCGQYFFPEEITGDEMEWLAKDFQAISFEKGHTIDPQADFFRNPVYRQKLTARYILEVIQENSSGGLNEVWD